MKTWVYEFSNTKVIVFVLQQGKSKNGNNEPRWSEFELVGVATTDLQYVTVMGVS